MSANTEFPHLLDHSDGIFNLRCASARVLCRYLFQPIRFGHGLDPSVRACCVYNTDLRKFLDTSVSSISGHIAGATYRAGEPGAQATAQSERIRPWSVANRFQAVSQASMMSARLRNTELASQWLRR